MMTKRIKKHFWYYIALGVIQLFGLGLIILFSNSRQTQLLIILLITTIYTLFALLHHHLQHDLNSKVVIEYVLMGALGVSFAFFVFSS